MRKQKASKVNWALVVGVLLGIGFIVTCQMRKIDATPISHSASNHSGSEVAAMHHSHHHRGS